MTYEAHIEAAALAICRAVSPDENFHLMPQADRDKYRQAARDGLTAAGWDKEEDGRDDW